MTERRKLHFLITAGGTHEYIDPVRYISNAGSGQMGYALAAAAVKKGHKATLISAPTNLAAPEGVKLVRVVSAADMFRAVKKHFKTCQCLIMTAAVADYTPIKKSKIKIKKSKSPLTLKLKPTADILAWAGKNKTHQFVVGFALEDKNIKQNAERKMLAKNADMIVANSPAAIGSTTSRLFIKTPSTDWRTIKNIAKNISAARVIRLISGRIVE